MRWWGTHALLLLCGVSYTAVAQEETRSNYQRVVDAFDRYEMHRWDESTNPIAAQDRYKNRTEIAGLYIELLGQAPHPGSVLTGWEAGVHDIRIFRPVRFSLFTGMRGEALHLLTSPSTIFSDIFLPIDMKTAPVEWRNGRCSEETTKVEYFPLNSLHLGGKITLFNHYTVRLSHYQYDYATRWWDSQTNECRNDDRIRLGHTYLALGVERLRDLFEKERYTSPRDVWLELNFSSQFGYRASRLRYRPGRMLLPELSVYHQVAGRSLLGFTAQIELPAPLITLKSRLNFVSQAPFVADADLFLDIGPAFAWFADPTLSGNTALGFWKEIYEEERRFFRGKEAIIRSVGIGARARTINTFEDPTVTAEGPLQEGQRLGAYISYHRAQRVESGVVYSFDIQYQFGTLYSFDELLHGPPGGATGALTISFGMGYLNPRRNVWR